MRYIDRKYRRPFLLAGFISMLMYAAVPLIGLAYLSFLTDRALCKKDYHDVLAELEKRDFCRLHCLARKVK